MPLMVMEHTQEPSDEVRQRVGSVDEIEVFGTQILIGIYQRPEQTKAGIFLPDAVRKEDEYQGKAGLVLKVGPLAFQDSATYSFGGMKVEVGDWILFRPGDSWPVKINSDKGACRFLEDVHVRARIAHPDHVW